VDSCFNYVLGLIDEVIEEGDLAVEERCIVHGGR